MFQAGDSFPPKEFKYWAGKFDECRAWYSADPDILSTFYSGLKTNIGVKFWSNANNAKNRTLIHLPIANDIATTSSNILFADTPDLEFKGPSDKEEPIELPRLVDLLEDNRWESKLREAAEICAAFGGVFFKINLDKSLSDSPILTTIVPTNAYPYFTGDFLTSVIFYRDVKITDTYYYRLFEERKIVKGSLVISFEIFRGEANTLGQVCSYEEAGLNSESYKTVTFNTKSLGVIYIQNNLPNKLVPGSPIGASDLNGGICTMMDGLDEFATGWVRDFRLGAAKIFVDESLVSNGEYDLFNEVYQKMDLGSLSLFNNGVKPIESVQFDVRFMEHSGSVENWIKLILELDGWSPESYGYNLKIYSESGSAMEIKEGKTLRTKKNKQVYFKYGLRELFKQLQEFDNILNNQSNDILLPSITFRGSKSLSLASVAQAINYLSTAQAMSTYQMVKELQPNWTDAQIQAEVTRIFDEQSKKAEMANKFKAPLVPNSQANNSNLGGSNVSSNE